MAVAPLVARLETRFQIGKYDSETGRLYAPPLLLTNDVIVPTSIDRTFVDEVTADLQAFFDATPDGSRIRCQPGGHYYCDDQLTLRGRKRIKLDGQNATIQAKRKLPFITLLSNVTITAPGDTGPYTVPGWGATNQAVYVQPGTFPTLGGFNNDQIDTNPPGDPPGSAGIPILSFIRSPVKSTGYRLAQLASKAFLPVVGVSTTVGSSLFNRVAHKLKNGQAVVPTGFVHTTGFTTTTYYVVTATADHFQLAATPGGTPLTMGGTFDTGLTVTPAPFTPGVYNVLILGANSGISRIALWTDADGERCEDIKVCDIHLIGTNVDGTYDAKVEGQHGVDCKGVDGAEIGPNVEIGKCWGDSLNLTVDNPAGPGTVLDPRPPGLAGGNACRNVYAHDSEFHHNGRQGTSLTGIIGFHFDRMYYHDCPRTGLDIEVPSPSVARDITGRNSRMVNVHFGFVSLASYPVGNNSFVDHILLESITLPGCAVIINNPDTTQRWTDIKFRNLDAGGALNPFGRSTPACVVEVLGVDGFEMTGCKQKMQVQSPVMFLVSARQSRVLDVHDNPIVCGPPWALTTHYTDASPLSQVTHNGNAYFCTTTHNSSAISEPGVGANWPSFWRSQQLLVDSFPVLSARLVTETDIGAVLNAVAPPPARLTAALRTETDLAVRLRTVRRLVAQLGTQFDLASTVVDVHPPARLTAKLVTEMRLAARVHTPRRGVPANEYRVGSGALTGPGWDDEPDGWDTQAWGGTG